MSSDVDNPKRELTPTTSLSSIPQKRAFDEAHSPAVPSPLNPDVKTAEAQPEDVFPGSRSKPARAKKETLKKREAKGIDSTRATPDPKRTSSNEDPKQSEYAPLRYKLAPPKLSDFEPARGPVLIPHHEVEIAGGETAEFFETSDQSVKLQWPPEVILLTKT